MEKKVSPCREPKVMIYRQIRRKEKLTSRSLMRMGEIAVTETLNQNVREIPCGKVADLDADNDKELLMIRVENSGIFCGMYENVDGSALLMAERRFRIISYMNGWITKYRDLPKEDRVKKMYCMRVACRCCGNHGDGPCGLEWRKNEQRRVLQAHFGK